MDCRDQLGKPEMATHETTVMPERAQLLEMCMWDGESRKFQLCLDRLGGGTESDLWTGA